MSSSPLSVIKAVLKYPEHTLAILWKIRLFLQRRGQAWLISISYCEPRYSTAASVSSIYGYTPILLPQTYSFWSSVKAHIELFPETMSIILTTLFWFESSLNFKGAFESGFSWTKTFSSSMPSWPYWLCPHVKTYPSAVNKPAKTSPHVTLIIGMKNSTSNGMELISCKYSSNSSSLN